MAVSAAGATATPAGTVITNVATLNFSDFNGTDQPPVDSPPVKTTVTPVPSFVLTPNDGSADVTKPDYTKPGQTNNNGKPGDVVVFPYQITNTGNVPGESYTLGNLPDPTGVVKPGTNVLYYLTNPDTNNDGLVSPAELTAAGTAITTISGVNQDQTVKFYQVYTVPTTALNTEKYGADPTGTRNPNTAKDQGLVINLPIDANNSNTTTIARQDGGVIGPKNDPTAVGGTPVYTSPEGVLITPDQNGKDTQTANATVTTTTITFTNTIKNNGNRPDIFTVAPNPANFPAGSTIVLLNPDGTPFTQTPSVNPGGTTDILVKVTLPAGSTSADATKQPTVTLTVISGNDPTKTDTTKDIVNLPGAKFGDVDPKTPGTDPTPVPAVPATPASPDPKDPTAVNVDPKVCTTTTNAFLPMGVKNTGGAPDRFVISGSTSIRLTNGKDELVNVTYYTDTNANGVLDAGEVVLPPVAGGQDTGLIAPGATLKLVAVIPVPCASAQGTYTINQKVVSPTSGTIEDKNDTVKVGGNGTPPVVTKTVDKDKAQPGDVLTYTISGTNKTNANIVKAILKDTVPVNTTYVSFVATSTSTGKVLYSTNGTTWSAAAPAAPQPDGSTIYTGVDTNNDGNITTADILKPGESISAIFKVQVK
ncbi:DUF11 domain-containing protein [Deinococcus psychrotolerans]|uniref:DUF11 domain-containing protein n=1 Tax=Deinococcus psychrotolerans TaxID=2489213 RepID=A0A3G8Y9F8_9DEIO|nr:DUF11 domain-containing protein [Deinococcus psychrotolerans]AZI41543.1 DUF11 domain-containing protein [Deinococcus psychrotolerans]